MPVTSTVLSMALAGHSSDLGQPLLVLEASCLAEASLFRPIGMASLLITLWESKQYFSTVQSSTQTRTMSTQTFSGPVLEVAGLDLESLPTSISRRKLISVRIISSVICTDHKILQPQLPRSRCGLHCYHHLERGSGYSGLRKDCRLLQQQPEPRCFPCPFVLLQRPQRSQLNRPSPGARIHSAAGCDVLRRRHGSSQCLF